MSATIRRLVIPVSDLQAAKAVYTALLGEPHTDQPYYVGYNVDGFEVGLNPGEDVAGGPVAFADVEDLDATLATLVAAGATDRSAPREVAPGVRVCVLADADGSRRGGSGFGVASGAAGVVRRMSWRSRGRADRCRVSEGTGVESGGRLR
jgi:catechol 2,3-dioxygenase-like lactoylglutathione lyase family enzyme